MKIKIEENKNNINAIPDHKIPQNKEKGEKSYNKNESFFDKLTPITKLESREESKHYNQRNKDTFNLNEQEHYKVKKNHYHNNNNYKGKGGYNKYYNNRGGYKNNNKYYNNKERFNNNYHNRRGYNKIYSGRGKGNFNNMFQNNWKNNNNNNKKENEQKIEKSIYDN